jgi:hypothetical protein
MDPVYTLYKSGFHAAFRQGRLQGTPKKEGEYNYSFWFASLDIHSLFTISCIVVDGDWTVVAVLEGLSNLP